MSDKKRKGRQVTYAGILDENLLESTVMLDTLTLDQWTKALDGARKSVKEAPVLSESTKRALHQMLAKSKQEQRDQVAGHISAYAVKLEKQESKRVKVAAAVEDDDSEADNSDAAKRGQVAPPLLTLDELVDALETEVKTKQDEMDQLNQDIEARKKSMTKNAKKLVGRLPDPVEHKDALRQGQREAGTAVRGLQQIIVYE